MRQREKKTFESESWVTPITSESVCLGVHEALRLGFDPVDVRKNYMTLVEGGNCARDLDALPLLDSPTSI